MTMLPDLSRGIDLSHTITAYSINNRGSACPDTNGTVTRCNFFVQSLHNTCISVSNRQSIDSRVKELTPPGKRPNRNILFQGWKVMSAVCTTVQNAGMVQTVLSRNGNQYTCTCAGPSTHDPFKPMFSRDGNKYATCKIIYWECPELT